MTARDQSPADIMVRLMDLAQGSEMTNPYNERMQLGDAQREAFDRLLLEGWTGTAEELFAVVRAL